MARLPALFLGHGNPMNAIQPSEYTEAWARIASELPRPKAILSISAHWYVAGSRVSAEERPRTIHDFGGFPRPLYQVQYPAPGSPRLAARVRDLLAPTPVELDTHWGLDHGTWSLLVHLYPEADIPVVQLGIDETLSAQEHYELARRLAPLRDEDVLVLGSGDVVHNLHAYAWGQHPQEPYDWAVQFENRVRAFLEARDFEAVVGYEGLGREAALSAPTPDHFLPLLYVLGVASKQETVTFPVEGFDGGSVSMLGVRFG
ncbi:MAG: 4,5-DOPA dioxygenase extradiol [Myxococcales bacterium]